MKQEFSNFILTEVLGNNAITWKFKATVNVTTKRFLRKPTTITRPLFRSYVGYWYFTDTGKYVPNEIRDLERRLIAEKGKEIQDCLSE